MMEAFDQAFTFNAGANTASIKPHASKLGYEDKNDPHLCWLGTSFGCTNSCTATRIY